MDTLQGHIGDFGTARPGISASFGWFGEEVRVHPDLSDLSFIDALRKAQEAGADEGGDGAINAVYDMAGVVVHPEDHERFWTTARANRQTLEDIANLATALIEALTARPTKLPSDSSGGQPPTEPSSTDDSFSEAMAALEGRPDLQLVVRRRQEYLAAG